MSRHELTWAQWLDTIRDAGFVPLPEEPIRPGDSYCAERNTGLKLLTCREVDIHGGYVVPVENAYWFDVSECVKVKLA